jgi:imidazolonepropionase-like amidohydrolase
MKPFVLQNFELLDVVAGELRSGHNLRIEDGRITALERGRVAESGAEVVDLGGRTLMPGLIDCHVHVCADGMTSSPPLMAAVGFAKAGHILHDTLMRGFTTVRDAGGADAGYRQAVETGLLLGPRLLVSGRPVSQTGGHGDTRAPSDFCPACASSSTYHVIADGVDDVRKAIREELRRGADQIKIMASGGVASPADPIDYVQYSMDELVASVDEATRANKYVMAHAYMPAAIRRAVEAGVRSIEHGNFLDEECAAMMVARGTFLVPTLIVYRRILSHGKQVGASELHLQKARQVSELGTRSLEIAQRAGVKMAYGSDLFKAPKEFQSEEFLVRAEVLPKADILRSATTNAAELLGLERETGRIAPGYRADLLVVEGNPLEDFACLQDQGRHLAIILKNGRRVKDVLTPLGPEPVEQPKSLGDNYLAWRRTR